MRINSLRNVIAKAAVATSAVLMLPVKAFAASGALEQLRNNALKTGSSAGIQTGTSNTLPELVGKLIQQAMALLGIILVVLVIYAGFLWMTAQGNEEKIKKAKGIISSAVVGLVLIFAAYAITDFVVQSLVNTGV